MFDVRLAAKTVSFRGYTLNTTDHHSFNIKLLCGIINYLYWSPFQHSNWLPHVKLILQVHCHVIFPTRNNASSGKHFKTNKTPVKAFTPSAEKKKRHKAVFRQKSKRVGSIEVKPPPLCIGWLIFKWSFEYTPPFIIWNNKLKNVKISQSRSNIFYIFVGSRRNSFF